jgi:hypothetical protein
VQEAFFYVLQSAPNIKLTPELQTAWEAVFKYVAEKMVAGFKVCEALNSNV